VGTRLITTDRPSRCALRAARGTKKKNMADLGVYRYLIKFRGTNQPHFVFLTPVFVRFRAFLGKGSPKTPQKHFNKKSMSKTFLEKVDNKFDVSFSS
jgi:hypothetical protein